MEPGKRSPKRSTKREHCPNGTSVTVHAAIRPDAAIPQPNRSYAIYEAAFWAQKPEPVQTANGDDERS